MKSAKKTLVELAVLIIVASISLLLLKPRLALWLSNKGVDYYNIGEVDKAVSFFKKSLKVKPDPKVYCNLAGAYREKGMLRESNIEYEQALRLDGDYTQAYFGLAYNYEDEHLYEQAIASLKAAQAHGAQEAQAELEQLGSEYAVFLFNQAIDAYLAGDKNQAEFQLNKGIELKPDFIFAHKMLGDIKFGQYRFREAIVDYQRAIALGLKDATIYNLYNDIGICYMHLEDYTEAARYLRKAHQLEPLNLNILYNFACILRDNKNFTEALEKYRELARIQFNYPNVHNNLADIYKLMGKAEQAEKEYRNEVEVVETELSHQPENIYSLNRLALAYNGLGRYAQAKEIVDRVIAKEPDYAEAYYTRARIYESLGEGKEAVDDLVKAKRLFPRAGFIDNYILRLKTRKAFAQSQELFSNDTLIYLTNGRQIKGRLKNKTEEQVFLDVLVGNSFGTIAIEHKDIRSMERLK